MRVSSPGRICLFGEHQDYLGLPIIAMAVSLRCKISGEKRNDRKVIIHKPDIGETESFFLDDLNYTNPRDYFKSGINICKSEGINFSQGIECEVTSNIPIQAGTGSSSALMVSWIHFLSQLADKPNIWQPIKIGELAFKAEVREFNEPGGMMDQYTSALGHLIYMQSKPKMNIKKLNPKLGTFVLGDSNEPKDTMDILKRCRDSRLKILAKLNDQNSDFDLISCSSDIIKSGLNENERILLKGTIQNRNLLREALTELEKTEFDPEYFGNILTEHHTVLRDVLGTSTPKIENMIEAAVNAGSFGAKINGSGGGGCMFAYAPEKPEIVAEAIESVGGESYIIQPDIGTTLD